LDIDNSKWSSRSTSPTTRAVDERTIEGRDTGGIVGEVVIPNYGVSLTCTV
jgi:hypothetical protein